MAEHKPVMYLVGKMKSDGSILPEGVYKSSHWARSHWDEEYTWRWLNDRWLSMGREWPCPVVIEINVID